MLELAACAVQEKQLNILPENIDWQGLSREAKSQGIYLSMFYVLNQIANGIPEEISAEYSRLARRATARNLQVEFSQAELVSVLEQKGYPYVILKGEASASYYPVPELRQLGDVDFMVAEGYVQPVMEAMKALGYECQWQDHHWMMEKGRSRLEMHLEPSGIPEKTGRSEIMEYFRTIYARSREVTDGSGVFRIAGDAHHGLILILHMLHHTVEEGLGLRHIMDWACYVRATAGETFWHDSLLPLLRQIGLFRFTAVMTKICAMYFGIVCPAWAEDAEEELCRQMMEDILAGGNFGQKDSARARAGNMIPNWEENDKKTGKIPLLYRTLRKSVLRKHPRWAKKPVRLFMAMTCKAIRYVALYLVGKRPSLLKAAARANARRSVYEQLRLFETENTL